MSTFERLYANWQAKLAALKVENDKHDYSPDGEAAYELAFRAAKQAYHLLCDAGVEVVNA